MLSAQSGAVHIQKALAINARYPIDAVYNNTDSFFSSPCDAVIIATPNNTHSFYTKKALSAGMHVLCEKPVAITTQALETEIQIAEKENRIFLPAFVNRFREDIRQFMELAAKAGNIREVEVRWIRKSGIPKPGTWITDKARAGGGALIDIGTHVIDIGLMLLQNRRIHRIKADCGRIRDIERQSARWNTSKETCDLPVDVETWVKGDVHFSDNTVLCFDVSWSSDVEEDLTSIRASGDQGEVRIDTLFGFSNNFTRDIIRINFHGRNDSKTLFLPLNHMYAYKAFDAMIQYFLGVIQGKEMSYLKSKDGLTVVEIVETVYKNNNELWK